MGTGVAIVIGVCAKAGTVAGSAVEAGLELAPGPAEKRLLASGRRKSSWRRVGLLLNEMEMPAGLLGDAAVMGAGGGWGRLTPRFWIALRMKVTCL
jgi:hypothetical protein